MRALAGGGNDGELAGADVEPGAVGAAGAVDAEAMLIERAGGAGFGLAALRGVAGLSRLGRLSVRVGVLLGDVGLLGHDGGVGDGTAGGQPVGGIDQW